MVLVVAAAWSPTVAAAPEVLPVSESEVAVDGLQDTFTFASAFLVDESATILLVAPDGSSISFVLNARVGSDRLPPQVWRLDGTQVSGPVQWTATGNLDGVPADGTWQWRVVSWHWESRDSSSAGYPDITLRVAGKSIRAGYEDLSPAFNNPQIWNWHGTADGATFQDDAPALTSQADTVVQPQEDPVNVRFFGPVAVLSPLDGSGLTERTLLHQEGVGVGPQPLPPVGTGGVPVPNVPAQPGQPVPDVPSTPGMAVPDHGGAGPIVTPGIGEPVGVLSTRDADAGANYCAYFTPEGGSEQLLTCVGRSFLGPLDPSMPRGDTALVFYDPIDVPPTGPIVTPDVPPTPAVVTPDVPPTPGVTTPDVPPVPVGSLGDSPSVTLDVDVSYSYDGGRLEPLVNVLGQQSWSPIGPTPADAAWLASPTNAAALTVTVTVYKDGVSQGTVGHSVPALGQVLAAAEKTAGTLP